MQRVILVLLCKFCYYTFTLFLFRSFLIGFKTLAKQTLIFNTCVPRFLETFVKHAEA